MLSDLSSRALMALCALAFVVAALHIDRTVTNVAGGFGVGCALGLGVIWLGERNPAE
jgi:hypothetical protein